AMACLVRGAANAQSAFQAQLNQYSSRHSCIDRIDELPDSDISRREASPTAADRKFLILAAGARAAAEDFVERHSLCAIVITRDEVGLSVRRLRELVRDYGIGAIAVHTPDWSRQLNPQVY